MVVEKKYFDVCVIGAGLIGTTVSYMISKADRSTSICQLDKSLSGNGTTFYSAGLDLPFYANNVHKEMGITSRQFYSSLKLSKKIATRTGLYLLSDQDEFEHKVFDAHFEKQGNYTIKCPVFSVIHPYKHVLKTHSFIYNPALLTEYYRNDLLKRERYSLFQGSLPSHIEKNLDGAYNIYLSNGYVITCRQIVYCPGPWGSHNLLPTLKDFYSKQDLRVKKVVSYIFRLDTHSFRNTCYFDDLDAFIMPLNKHQMTVSIRSTDWDCQPHGESMYLSESDELILKKLFERIKLALPVKQTGAKVFCDLYSPDRVPVIASVAEDTDIIFAGACSGSGLRLAPAVAQKVLLFLKSKKS